MVDFLTFDFEPNRQKALGGKKQCYDTKYASVCNDLVVVYENAVMKPSEFKVK
jgi:hypothetical protein